MRIRNIERPKGQTVVYSGPKIGRNVPCTCGSGKKFKTCCLLKYKAAKQLTENGKKK